jgi:PAS domain S-box-containing protein
MSDGVNMEQDFTQNTETNSISQTIIDNMPFMAWLKDKEGRFIAVNQLFADSCKKSVKEIIGKTDFDTWSKELAECYVADDLKVMTSNKQKSVEEPIDTLEGIKWFETYKAPVHDKQGNVIGTTGFSRDITERKQIDKLKNEFISTVSHELRTPLTSIRGALGIVLSGSTGELSESARTLLDIANNNSARLISLINDILDIEKIEAGKMEFNLELFDVMELVEQSVKINMPYAEQYKIEFFIENHIGNAKIKVDKDRLGQVLANLLSNAAKFSCENSRVKIVVTRENHNIRIAVSDTGKGIPMDFQCRIFQKFAQADSSISREKGGTGLGLSICKAIVEKMNGSIDFISEVNKGSVFYFDLPEYVYEIPKVSSDKSQDFARILICEDDKDVAEIIETMLKEEHYIVDVAYNTEQAKQLLNENCYDALTLDLILPDGDGLEFIKELKENPKTQNLPIIVVSIKAEEGKKEIDHHFAVFDWINKPFEKTKLLKTIQKAFVNKREAKPSILYIEDDKDLQEIVCSILQKEADIVGVSSFAQAEKLLKNNEFNLILLDIELKDGNGINLLPLINKHKEKKASVIIFSATEVDAEIASKVDAVLLKSKTSNEDLLNILSLI